MSITISKVPLSTLTNAWPARDLSSVNPVAGSVRPSSRRRAENPVLVDESLCIVAGLIRFLRAEKRGAEYISVAIIPGLTPAQKEKLRASDEMMGPDRRWTLPLLRRRLEGIGYAVAKCTPIDRDSPDCNASCETRFKPGRSGNPKGRPKLVATDRNFAEVLSEVQLVRMNGKPALISNREMLEREMIESVRSGNPGALQRTIARMDQVYPLKDQVVDQRRDIKITFVSADGKEFDPSERPVRKDGEK